MDSSVNNVQQSFLDAMDIIASRRVKEANYDKTIVGTINSWIKDNNGKAVYKINYNGGFFNASVLNNQDSYLKNTPVYIFVPQGDFSQEKIILGKVSNINTDINIAVTAASLNNFSIVGKNNLNWISEDNNAALKSYLKNNFNWIYKIADNNNSIDIDMKSLKQYLTEGTAIMVKADFRTALPFEQKQQASAEYGLIFNLIFNNEYLKWGNTQGEILQTIIDRDIVKKKINDEECNLKNYISGIEDIINKMTDIGESVTNPDSLLRAKVFKLEAFYNAFIKNLTIEDQKNEINIIKNIIESYLIEVNLYFDFDETKTIDDIKGEYQNWKNKSIEQDNKIVPLSLDSNQMIGSPLYFKDWTTQYAVFEIEDLQDFNCIDSILFFKRGFETSLDEEKIKDDIFVKNICFYVLKPLESVSGDYFLKVECSEQGSILQETGIKETTFKARFFRKTEDITGNTNISYYWFKEDPSITIGQEFYHPYGGQGWKLINKLTKNSLFTTTYVDNPTLKNNYKCIAVLENSDSTVLITASFIVYNADKGYVIDLQSDIGSVFQSDIGTPIITCTVNGEEKTALDNNKILLKYYWSFITQDNKIFSLQDIQLEEDQELDFSKLAPLNFNYYQSQDQYLKNIKLYTPDEKETKNIFLATRLQYPISNLSLNEIFTVKCDVTKVENETEVLIGSGEVKLEKRGGIAIEGYHIEFENDGQVFQYDEYGNSPKLNGKLDSLEILPIRAKLVAPNGIELAGTNVQVNWIFNLNNSMIIPLDDVTATNGILKDKTICNFDIKDLYDPDAINNQILCHIHFNEKDYYKQTNLLFRKIGENGTNGTDVIVQIRPASSDSILDTQPLTLYTFDNEEKGFFNNNYYTNINTVTNSQISIAKLYNKNSTNTNKEEKDSDLLKSYIYQKNELLTLDKIDSITWTLAGNPSESIINKGKHFEIANNTLYWNSSEDKSPYQLQIIKAHIKKDNQDYYSYYPLPIINYHIDKNNIESYAKKRLAIDKDSYLKEIMYNADGRNPIYNHNQGLKIINLPENSKLIITAKGGWNKEEDDPDFLLLQQELDESSGQIIQELVKEITIEDSNNFDMIYILPNDTCGGSKTNNRIEVKIQTKETNNEYIDYATLYVPIIFTLNTFGLASLNAWDGNTITIDEEGGYVMAPQIGAGEKDDNNRFTGIVMGKTEIPTGGVEEEKQVGLLGYSHGLQSIFLDAETGNATFGLPSGYILEEEDNVFVPKKSDNNNNYREGRIELRPGGISNIGGWRIGHKSLYYTNEEGTLGNKNGVEQPDYILRPDGTIGIPEADASAKGEERERQLNPYGYYHDKDIAHDQGGILLYGGNEPYISIKTKPLGSAASTEDDSLLTEEDSLELQLDPNTPTLFTIFRHNGKVRYTDTTNQTVLYPKDSRTFLAGINNKGEFVANTITNKSTTYLPSEDGGTENTVSDIGSKFYFNTLAAFNDTKERPYHIGFQMTAKDKILGQFFTSLTDVINNNNTDSISTLHISGGNESLKSTDSKFKWGEYLKNLALHGKQIALYAPNNPDIGNLRSAKTTDSNIIVSQTAGQIQIESKNDLFLLTTERDTETQKEKASQLATTHNFDISIGKDIPETYSEDIFIIRNKNGKEIDRVPLRTYGDAQYFKIQDFNGTEFYIWASIINSINKNSLYWLEKNKEPISIDSSKIYYKFNNNKIYNNAYNMPFYKYKDNNKDEYILKSAFLTSLYEYDHENNTYNQINFEDIESEDYNLNYFAVQKDNTSKYFNYNGNGDLNQNWYISKEYIKNEEFLNDVYERMDEQEYFKAGDFFIPKFDFSNYDWYKKIKIQNEDIYYLSSLIKDENSYYYFYDDSQEEEKELYIPCSIVDNEKNYYKWEENFYLDGYDLLENLTWDTDNKTLINMVTQEKVREFDNEYDISELVEITEDNQTILVPKYREYMTDYRILPRDEYSEWKEGDSEDNKYLQYNKNYWNVKKININTKYYLINGTNYVESHLIEDDKNFYYHLDENNSYINRTSFSDSNSIYYKVKIKENNEETYVLSSDFDKYQYIQIEEDIFKEKDKLFLNEINLNQKYRYSSAFQIYEILEDENVDNYYYKTTISIDNFFNFYPISSIDNLEIEYVINENQEYIQKSDIPTKKYYWYNNIDNELTSNNQYLLVNDINNESHYVSIAKWNNKRQYVQDSSGNYFEMIFPEYDEAGKITNIDEVTVISTNIEASFPNKDINLKAKKMFLNIGNKTNILNLSIYDQNNENSIPEIKIQNTMPINIISNNKQFNFKVFNNNSQIGWIALNPPTKNSYQKNKESIIGAFTSSISSNTLLNNGLIITQNNTYLEHSSNLKLSTEKTVSIVASKTDSNSYTFADPKILIQAGNDTKVYGGRVQLILNSSQTGWKNLAIWDENKKENESWKDYPLFMINTQETRIGLFPQNYNKKTQYREVFYVSAPQINQAGMFIQGTVFNSKWQATLVVEGRIEVPNLSNIVYTKNNNQRNLSEDIQALQDQINTIRTSITNLPKTLKLDDYAKKSDLGSYAKTSDLDSYAKTSDLKKYAKTSHTHTIRYDTKTILTQSVIGNLGSGRYRVKTDTASGGLDGYTK